MQGKNRKTENGQAPQPHIPHRHKNILISRLYSFKFAFQGLIYMFRTQLNSRIQLIIALIAIGFGIYFGITAWEWMVLIIMIALVFAAELFNSSLEKITDIMRPEQSLLAGKAKDMAAAAVLLTATAAFIAGVIIFLPHFASLFGITI